MQSHGFLPSARSQNGLLAAVNNTIPLCNRQFLQACTFSCFSPFLFCVVCCNVAIATNMNSICSCLQAYCSTNQLTCQCWFYNYMQISDWLLVCLRSVGLLVTVGRLVCFRSSVSTQPFTPIFHRRIFGYFSPLPPAGRGSRSLSHTPQFTPNFTPFSPIPSQEMTPQKQAKNAPLKDNRDR